MDFKKFLGSLFKEDKEKWTRPMVVCKNGTLLFEENFLEKYEKNKRLLEELEEFVDNHPNSGFVVNGQVYARISDVPPDVRPKIEMIAKKKGMI